MSIKLFKCPQDNDKIATILKNMDYSPLLAPFGTEEKIEQICNHAKKFKIGRIVPLQRYHKSVFTQIEGTAVKVVMGLSDVVTLEESCESVRIGMKQGCNEVDMMMKLPLLLDGKYDAVQNEISQIAAIASSYGRIIKVIIETGFLTDEQKILASKLALEAGATFIKTNLGMRPGRANIHDILLLKDAFGDKIKVKASGSVASLEDAWAFWEAGAERFAMRENLVA
ncbi:MAG: deoxyribose-phosphate aldolase, partial [Ruminiclostridium sp.]